jgi:hypothetical protein
MLFTTEAGKEDPGEVVEARRDVEASGVRVKAEAHPKVVGEEAVTAAETDSKYLVLMQSQRQRASQQMTDSHNHIHVLLYLQKGNGILWQILYSQYLENERKSNDTGKIR